MSEEQLTIEEAAALKKQAADAAVVNLALTAMQMADLNDDPRIKAIEDIAVQQLGNDPRLLLRMVAAQPQQAPKTDPVSLAQQQAAQSNQMWADTQARINKRNDYADELMMKLAAQLSEKTNGHSNR